jgi:hypothetical protein
VYSSSWGPKPTWFQEFIAALNDNLLGDAGWGSPGTCSLAALHSEVAKAMNGGDGKPGRARK